MAMEMDGSEFLYESSGWIWQKMEGDGNMEILDGSRNG
jgi:hypothetical protein